MGCGQSKIHLYPRKSKSKANGKKGGHDAETDEDESYFDDPDKCQNREPEKTNEVTEEPSNKNASESDEEVSVSLLRAKNLSLLQSQEISTSQQNFFRMLDKKIEEGPDYDSASETELALEEARLNALVQHWESASLTASICSSASRSLQGTPIRQTPIKQLATPRSVLKSAFGMPQTQTQQLQQQQQQQQVLTTTDYPQLGTSPHPPLQMTAVVGPIRSVPNPSSLLLTNLNSQMLQQMQNAAVSGQLPINLMSDATATTANTSNVLALMQTATTSAKPTQQQQQQQLAHLLTLPAGTTGQLAIGKPNLSPKHLADGRMLIATSPLAQQIQQQQQQPLQQQQGMPPPPMPIPSQYIATAVIAGASAPTAAIVGNGSRTEQQQQQMLPLQMACYGQNVAAAAQLAMPAPHQHPADIPMESQSPSNYGDIMHNVQAPPAEYRFPPAISVQRLAPQVQRQLRETQELIKDTCPQLYAAGYGSPGPPIRNPARNPNRRPTLETQLSQELS